MVRTVVVVFMFMSFSLGQVCTGFRPGQLSDQALRQQFSGAVLDVQEIGTAYLVDSSRGYLITANHVLEDLSKANKANKVSSEAFAGQSFPFNVVTRNKDLDIALLQLQDSAALKTLRAIDITEDLPDADTALLAMGYPLYGVQARPILRIGDAKFNAWTPGGFLEVEHLTVGGNSGGPLLEKSGYVVATCEEETEQNKIGRYVPMSSVLQILHDIPVSQKMLDIESDIQSGKVGVGDLKRILQQPSTSPSNLELYLWSKRLNGVLKNTPSLLAAVRPLLHCPIFPVLYERALPDAMQQLMPFAEDTDKARGNLFYSGREYRLGHDSTALAFANAAHSLFLRAGDHGGEGEALILKGSIEERTNFLDAAEKSFKEAAKLVESDSLRAEALQGLGRTESRIGRDRSAKAHFQQANTLFEQDHDTKGQFEALSGIADVEKKKGQYMAAEETLNKAISVVHTIGSKDLEAETWYKLGGVQLQVGDETKAMTSFEKVVSLEPANTPLVVDSTKVLSAQRSISDVPKLE